MANLKKKHQKYDDLNINSMRKNMAKDHKHFHSQYYKYLYLSSENIPT